MKGLAVFADSADDPYITANQDDSEDERERDAMRIRPNDDLIVAAKYDGVCFWSVENLITFFF